MSFAARACPVTRQAKGMNFIAHRGKVAQPIFPTPGAMPGAVQQQDRRLVNAVRRFSNYVFDFFHATPQSPHIARLRLQQNVPAGAGPSMREHSGAPAQCPLVTGTDKTVRWQLLTDSGRSGCGIAVGDSGRRCRGGIPESKTAPEGPFASSGLVAGVCFGTFRAPRRRNKRLLEGRRSHWGSHSPATDGPSAPSDRSDPSWQSLVTLPRKARP